MHNMFRADLHCHTTCSDGTMAPADLVRHAKEVGLSGLSITDHDTLDAYATAIPVAKEVGIRLGAGIELSCAFKGKNVHLLGYDFSLHSPVMGAFCTKHSLRRKERNRRILEKLKSMKIVITEEELQKANPHASVLGRPHIAKVMIEKGVVRAFKDAFDHFIGDGKPCYDPGEPFSAEETIEVIHQSGGKAFLAHPHLLESARLTRELLTLDFEGIECYYGTFLPSQEKKWIKVAQEKKWLVSGGSDFHGALKPYQPLGSSWVNEEIFNKIFQNDLSRDG